MTTGIFAVSINKLKRYQPLGDELALAQEPNSLFSMLRQPILVPQLKS